MRIAMSFSVGQITPNGIHGDISTLQWIKPGFENSTEASLGYRRGRLSQGYWILLLTSLPRPDQFEFAGTTLRSGGKYGLPQGDKEAEAARPRVHDKIVQERGEAGYEQLQRTILAATSVAGETRLVKIIPDIPHSDEMPASLQYPMGGGGLQWRLKKPGIPMLVAARIDRDATAHIPGETLYPRATYEDRARLRRYLCDA
jgi:hypothetical protein